MGEWGGARWPSGGAQWSSGLERWLGLATGQSGRVRIPLRKTSLRNFGNSVYPALPVSFEGDTKSRRSLPSGVYARGSKISHQSALECVTVVDSTTHSNPPPPPFGNCGIGVYALYSVRPIVTQAKKTAQPEIAVCLWRDAVRLSHLTTPSP